MPWVWLLAAYAVVATGIGVRMYVNAQAFLKRHSLELDKEQRDQALVQLILDSMKWPVLLVLFGIVGLWRDGSFAPEEEWTAGAVDNQELGETELEVEGIEHADPLTRALVDEGWRPPPLRVPTLDEMERDVVEWPA